MERNKNNNNNKPAMSKNNKTNQIYISIKSEAPVPCAIEMIIMRGAG